MTDPTQPGEAGAPDEGMPTPAEATAASVDDAFATIEEQMLVDGFDVDVDDRDTSRSSAEVERDEYREALQRVKAEFDNFRKRTAKEALETRERAAEALVLELLPVLDACDAAMLHEAADVGPISKMLLDSLEKQGLEPMIPEGQPFDPELHEAVLHEPGDGGESVVTESLRTGYLWKGRVLRPAMVKVRG